MRYRIFFIIAIIFSLSFSLASCATLETTTATSVPTRESRTSTPSEVVSPEATVSEKNQEAEAQKTPANTASSEARHALAMLAAKPVSGSTALVVTLSLQDVVDLYGIEVHLIFDPSAVQVKDGDTDAPGIQISTGPDLQKSSFVALNRADNNRGTIDLAVTLLKPAKPLQGDVVVAAFSLEGIEKGSTDIEFEQVLLADGEGNSLPVVSEGISIEVEP